MLAAAACAAMAFVWWSLCDGEPGYTLSQVALNELIMICCSARAGEVPWDTLLLSIALYILGPVIVAQIVRLGMPASDGGIGGRW